MSKRYGRNQKRQHVEHIASLLNKVTTLQMLVKERDAAIVTMKAGDYLRATGKHPALASLIDGIGTVEITDTLYGGRRERTATIQVWADDIEKLQEVLYRRDLVEWEGTVWRIGIEVDRYQSTRRDMIYDRPELTVKLNAIADPNDSYVRMDRHIPRIDNRTIGGTHDSYPRQDPRPMIVINTYDDIVHH